VLSIRVSKARRSEELLLVSAVLCIDQAVHGMALQQP
jgi:hypothetical protein